MLPAAVELLIRNFDELALDVPALPAIVRSELHPLLAGEVEEARLAPQLLAALMLRATQ